MSRRTPENSENVRMRQVRHRARKMARETEVIETLERGEQAKKLAEAKSAITEALQILRK